MRYKIVSNIVILYTHQKITPLRIVVIGLFTHIWISFSFWADGDYRQGHMTSFGPRHIKGLRLKNYRKRVSSHPFLCSGGPGRGRWARGWFHIINAACVAEFRLPGRFLPGESPGLRMNSEGAGYNSMALRYWGCLLPQPTQTNLS